jgi:hypothetical protein
MTGAGSGLMAASPVGPVESVDHVVQRLDDNRGEQSLDLVAGQRDQVGWPWTVGVFACTDDRAEGVGEHDQGDPTAQEGVAANLVLVESRQPFLRLEGFPPPATWSRRP